MLNGLTVTWIFNPPFDLEHKQLLLSAYMRDAQKIFNSNKLSPYFEDLEIKIKNLECYNSTKAIMKRDCKELISADKELVDYISKLPDDHKDRIAVSDIVGWSLDQLYQLRKHAVSVWNHIEGSLAMSFIGEKPKNVKNGYLFIRYPGSYIVETYKFKSNADGSVTTKFVSFDENKDDTYMDTMARYPGINPEYSAYIAVEPTKPFNTIDAVMPVVRQVLKSKVISTIILPPGPSDTYMYMME